MESTHRASLQLRDAVMRTGRRDRRCDSVENVHNTHCSCGSRSYPGWERSCSCLASSWCHTRSRKADQPVK